jgi:hypothetical protein
VKRRTLLKALAAIPFVGVPLAAVAEKKWYATYRTTVSLTEWPASSVFESHQEYVDRIMEESYKIHHIIDDPVRSTDCIYGCNDLPEGVVNTACNNFTSCGGMSKHKSYKSLMDFPLLTGSKEETKSRIALQWVENYKAYVKSKKG